jgi:pimeloyl-ACP methyl ester carboxylesterase
MMEPIEIRLPSGEIMRGGLQAGTASSDCALIYVHGFGSHRGGEKAAALASACARREWTFAAADFRGHGNSDGTTRELTAAHLLEDLSALHAFLAKRGYLRLALVGSSMGGFASAWFAVRNPDAVLACVLLAPAFRFLHRRWEELTEAQRADWARTGVRRVRNEWLDIEIGYGLVEERDAFDPAELARNWRAPLLIYHGLADDVVPVEESLAFINATPYDDVELRLVKDGDHRLTKHKDAIAEASCQFIAERLAR